MASEDVGFLDFLIFLLQLLDQHLYTYDSVLRATSRLPNSDLVITTISLGLECSTRIWYLDAGCMIRVFETLLGAS